MSADDRVKSLEKNKSFFIASIVAGVCVLIAAVVLGAIWFFDADEEQGTYSGDSKVSVRYSLSYLFGDDISKPDKIIGDEVSKIEQDDGNLDIPFVETKTANIFSEVGDKNYYLKAVSYTYTYDEYNMGWYFSACKREYAVKEDKTYFTLEVNGVKRTLLSGSEGIYYLDFNENKYSVYSPEPLTFKFEYDFCFSEGRAKFSGETEYDYEDFLISNNPVNIWIRHYFSDEGDWLGYEIYDDGALEEVFVVEELTSDIPENRDIIFEVPEGFKFDAGYIDASEIIWD